MSRLLTSRKIYDFFMLSGLFLSIFALLRFPTQSIDAATEGLRLSANVIIPSLFPFFVLSNLMIALGLTRYIGRLFAPVMRPLFNVSGACASAFVLGFIGGYPVGAKTAIGLYNSGSISKHEAERLLAFCNNSGPAFIFGVVGVSIFASSRVGLVLYLAHALASVMVGILFRNWGSRRMGGGAFKQIVAEKPEKLSTAFVQSVTGAFRSALGICGFVVFFTVFIRLLFLSGAIPAATHFFGTTLHSIGLSADWIEMLFVGLIEISSGVFSLREVTEFLPGAIAMAAFMLGWAGLSVHCQVLSFIGQSGLSVRSYILGKFLHGIFSTALTFLLIRIIPLQAPVAAYLAEGVEGIVRLDWARTLQISTIAAVVLGVGAVWAKWRCKSTGRMRISSQKG